jgi:thioester reductase-like protein
MKENQELVQMHGVTPISDPINKGISHLLRAMKADFAQKFSSRFGDEIELRDYKQRLRKIFENNTAEDIYDAYERYLDTFPEWPPTNIDLRSHLENLLKERKKKSENKAEAERLAALPAPTIECNPVEMLVTAKKSTAANRTKEEEQIARDEALKNHNAILTIHGHKIKRRYAQPSHYCAVDGCRKPGGISGGGNFYCADHYRMQA